MKEIKLTRYWVEIEQLSVTRRLVQIDSESEEIAKRDAVNHTAGKLYEPHYYAVTSWSAKRVGDTPSTARTVNVDSEIALAI